MDLITKKGATGTLEFAAGYNEQGNIFVMHAGNWLRGRQEAFDDIFVVPTRDSFATYGKEYLDLYRRIDFSDLRKHGAWRPNQTQGVLVESL